MIPISDAETLALRALAFVVADDALAERFLALTGLTPATLRDRAGQRDVLAAVITFLEGHEPSLIATADALDVVPARLVAAGAVLA